jgi:hypothetical protein
MKYESPLKNFNKSKRVTFVVKADNKIDELGEELEYPFVNQIENGGSAKLIKSPIKIKY